MDGLAIDLTTYRHFERKIGQITVSGTWYLLDERGPQPCLILQNRLARGTDSPIVLLDDAWRWAEDTGDGRDCATMCAQYAEYLGLPKMPQSAMAVLHAVRECLSDLIAMPPLSIDRGPEVGSMTITHADGRVEERALHGRH